LNVRPALEPDESFLVELFSERKRAEFSRAGWPGPLLEAIVRQQASLWLRARARMQTLVLEEAGHPVGALVLVSEGGDLRLVELVIAAAWRRKGFARAALRDLLRQADASGTSVVLCTEPGGHAEALYRAHGFENDGAEGPSIRLRRRHR